MFRSNRWLAGLLVTAATAVLVPLLTARPCAAKPKEIVVVGSKIKENVQDAGLRVGPGFIDAVNDQVFDELLQDAVERAQPRPARRLGGLSRPRTPQSAAGIAHL